MGPYSLVRLPALGSSPEGAAPRAEAWVTQVPPFRERQKQDSALLSSRVGCTTAPVIRAVLPSSIGGLDQCLSSAHVFSSKGGQQFCNDAKLGGPRWPTCEEPRGHGKGGMRSGLSHLGKSTCEPKGGAVTWATGDQAWPHGGVVCKLSFEGVAC